MKYGHLGRFNVYQQNSYQYDPGADVFRHVGWEDTAVYFNPSAFNPELAAITQQYFNLFDREPYSPFFDGPYDNLLTVQNNALLNDQGAPATYGLWNYYGSQSNGFSKFDNRQFRVSASGSAGIGDHAIQLGFEYEQRRDAFYSVAPVGLWTLARLTANSHIKEIDTSDSTITNIGTNYYVTYDRLIGDNQFEFDRNLREALGLDPDGNDYINVDAALDPNNVDISMFGADDLLNQGSNYVTYSGFDHHGNALTGRPSIEDFFNETNDNGYRTRPVGAYEPIYIAGFVMDKFTFDDIIFNVGLRVDRFDANQPVPKTRTSSVRPTASATSPAQLLEDLDPTYTVPENIGDDYAVYVDAYDNPTSVVGYRYGDTWFNAAGTEVQDPDVLAVNEVYPAPWLQTDQDAPLTSNAFRDYEPQVNLMPRISFSFNISDEAVFFAHYDILTQRPTSNIRFSPIDYLFMRNRDALIANPNLRPEKTVDYSIGFQQVLSKTSSLKLEAFYKELRDMIQVRNFTGAFPRPYRAFGNLDFGTVKGLTVSYDLRRTGNVRMNANYTLQFADGTGSTTDGPGPHQRRPAEPAEHQPAELRPAPPHRLQRRLPLRFRRRLQRPDARQVPDLRQHRLQHDRQPRFRHAVHLAGVPDADHRRDQPLHRGQPRQPRLPPAVHPQHQHRQELRAHVRRGRGPEEGLTSTSTSGCFLFCCAIIRTSPRVSSRPCWRPTTTATSPRSGSRRSRPRTIRTPTATTTACTWTTPSTWGFPAPSVSASSLTSKGQPETRTSS